VAEELNPNRARDHLANERTFLAWVRTAVAIVVFGFAIGRFSIAMRQLTALQGHPLHRGGLSVWMEFDHCRCCAGNGWSIALSEDEEFAGSWQV